MVTPLQRKIFDFISDYIEQRGYSPSLTEIAVGIGISPNSISLVSRSIHSLVKAGQLKFHKKGYRNIEIAGPDSVLSLPILGRIAAGSPIEAIEDRKMLDLGYALQSENSFVLQVKGDSMVDEGILDGDYVICKHTDHVPEGEIVVALIDRNEATLKRVSYKTKNKITLIPANSHLKPKSYLPQRIQIQGVFMGLLRLKTETL